MLLVLVVVFCVASLAGCAVHRPAMLSSASTVPSTSSPPTTRPVFNTRPGQPFVRSGDEIMACGQLFHTGAPVVLWLDPGGYDAYRVERRFVANPEDGAWAATTQATTIKTPNRYGVRDLTAAEQERVRNSGWDLGLLQQKVDQFVIHYDVCGTSRQCFAVLHDDRGLSVHFLLDLDGTIYQTLDLKERAWHATIANGRSIGVEIANVGAYAGTETDPFKNWYAPDEQGNLRITLPTKFGDGGIRTPGFVGRPARPKMVFGTIQGHRRRQYDFTPEQYDSLARLTATLCTVFPKLQCDYPKDANGKLIPHKLEDEQLARYQGLLGHYHVQADKADPGPALQWEKVIKEARELMKGEAATQPTSQPTTRP